MILTGDDIGMKMTPRALEIQETLDQLDEEIKTMRQTQKNQRDMMYAELGKEFYKASGAKSYAEAFSKIEDTTSQPTQEAHHMAINDNDIQFLTTMAHHMTQGDNGNWRLSREELQKLVNHIHDMFLS